MTKESESEPQSEVLRSSLPEELDPIKSLSIDRAPEQRANIWASVDIARKYLYTDKEGFYDSKASDNLLDDLHEKIFPRLNNVQIKDLLEKNGWPDSNKTPNTNDDPNDFEEFRWFIRRWNGTVDRYPTEREEYAKLRREAKESEDPIERYCYDIRGIIPWYDITYDEKKRLTATREERYRGTSIAGRKEPTDEQQERQEWLETTNILSLAQKPERMTDKEWATKKKVAKKLRRELKRERDDDMKLWSNNPTGMFNRRVDNLRLMCYCNGRVIRNGRICKICRLAKKVDEYMLNLFKDAAEGRSSNIF